MFCFLVVLFFSELFCYGQKNRHMERRQYDFSILTEKKKAWPAVFTATLAVWTSENTPTSRKTVSFLVLRVPYAAQAGLKLMISLPQSASYRQTVTIRGSNKPFNSLQILKCVLLGPRSPIRSMIHSKKAPYCTRKFSIQLGVVLLLFLLMFISHKFIFLLYAFLLEFFPYLLYFN